MKRARSNESTSDEFGSELESASVESSADEEEPKIDDKPVESYLKSKKERVGGTKQVLTSRLGALMLPLSGVERIALIEKIKNNLLEQPSPPKKKRKIFGEMDSTTLGRMQVVSKAYHRILAQPHYQTKILGGIKSFIMKKHKVHKEAEVFFMTIQILEHSGTGATFNAICTDEGEKQDKMYPILKSEFRKLVCHANISRGRVTGWWTWTAKGRKTSLRFLYVD